MNDASAWIDSIRIKNTKTRNELDFFEKQSARGRGSRAAAPRQEEKLGKVDDSPRFTGISPAGRNTSRPELHRVSERAPRAEVPCNLTSPDAAFSERIKEIWSDMLQIS